MSTDSASRIDDVMTRSVKTISASATLREAATKMRDEGINSLIIPGSDTGILTSTDVLDGIAEGHDPDECTVGDVMTSPVEWVSADLRLQEAASMMDTYGINHLPVRDQHGDYVGIVSSTDLRQTLASSIER